MLSGGGAHITPPLLMSIFFRTHNPSPHNDGNICAPVFFARLRRRLSHGFVNSASKSPASVLIPHQCFCDSGFIYFHVSSLFGEGRDLIPASLVYEAYELSHGVVIVKS